MKPRAARYCIGEVVKHRKYPFRGVIFDIDPVFANSEEWYLSIPEDVRPTKDQPFYHLYAENADTEYTAYVSEQISFPTTTKRPCATPGGRRVRAQPRGPLHQAQQYAELKLQACGGADGCGRGPAQGPGELDGGNLDVAVENGGHGDNDRKCGSRDADRRFEVAIQARQTITMNRPANAAGKSDRPDLNRPRPDATP